MFVSRVGRVAWESEQDVHVSPHCFNLRFGEEMMEQGQRRPAHSRLPGPQAGSGEHQEFCVTPRWNVCGGD